MRRSLYVIVDETSSDNQLRYFWTRVMGMNSWVLDHMEARLFTTLSEARGFAKRHGLFAAGARVVPAPRFE